ncbi:MAG TPA: aldo/keto reductase [Chthoniobacterales bacterium]
MLPSIRWGILGAGKIARKFAAELPFSRTGRLVAIGSRSLETALRFASEFPDFNVKAYDSYEAVLEDPEVDAVYIATPHPIHAEWSVATAEAKKHVLCEKPLTMNHAEAMTVIEAARRNGVFLMEAFMYRCHPRTQRIAGLVREGAIGPVKLVRVAFSFAVSPDPAGRLFANELGGGGILDLGCYTTSIARLIAGVATGKPFEDPSEVNGAAVLTETGVDGLAIANLRFPGGVLAQVSCGIRLRQEDTLVVYGETGKLVVPAFWNPPGVIEHHDYESGAITNLETDAFAYKYGLEADAVADALPGTESHFVSWADSLGNMRALDAWRESAEVVHQIEQPESPHQRRRTLRPGRWGEIPSRRIIGLHLPMSRVVLGVDSQRTYVHLAAMADDFVERGGNAFDTAHQYTAGLQEKLLGHWIANRGVRDRIAVVVKGAHTPFCDPENLRKQFEISLDRLQTDYADIYLMHRDNPEIPVGEFVDVLDELYRAGRVRLYGGSNWSLQRLREANKYARKTGREPFRVVSNNLSLARMIDPVWRGCISAKGDEWREWFQETGAALFSWSSQARGYFAPNRETGSVTDAEILRCWDSEDNQERRRRAIELAGKKGVSPLNVALAFVLNQPFSAFALVGPRTIEETRTILPGIKLSLTPDELAWLDLQT